jgi:hypothetical protein
MVDTFSRDTTTPNLLVGVNRKYIACDQLLLSRLLSLLRASAARQDPEDCGKAF